MLVKCSDQ